MLGLEFASGKLNIYELDTALTPSGSMPVERLTLKSWTYYGDRTINHTRLYEALGADTRIDKLVRIPEGVEARVGWYVIPEDGEQYRIDAVAPVIVATNHRATELTLIRLEARYDIGTE